MLSKCIRVRLLVPIAGGISARPFAPDPTDRGRFPPRIRLEATLLGRSLGTLDMMNEDRAGRIVDLSVPQGWLHAPVAACLLAEIERVARLTSWKQMVWDPPPEQANARVWAERHGFSASADGLLQKPLDVAAPAARMPDLVV